MRFSETTRTIKILKAHKEILTFQQFKTLRGQAIAGDCEGALKGLHKILTRRERKK